MAYKISYKVAAEQAEQLKNIAKDMDNYVNQVNQIVGKLGNDELLQSVRNDLNKFKKQLEEEKTILNFASSVISDVIQSFSGVEKKSVGKVDKAKAHNRDFYKRPVAVASAGGGAAAAGAGAAAAAGAGAAAAGAAALSGSTSSTTILSISEMVFKASSTAFSSAPVTINMSKLCSNFSCSSSSAGGTVLITSPSSSKAFMTM